MDLLSQGPGLLGDFGDGWVMTTSSVSAIDDLSECVLQEASFSVDQSSRLNGLDTIWGE